MNKTLLLLFISITISFAAYSQCTPVPFPGPSFTNPDTAQGLSPAVATQTYHQVIHVRIPKDTLIPPLTVPVTIDSAGIVDIVSLPPGLSYVTNSATDFWPGGSYGCIVIQGVVAENDTGMYNPEVQVQVMVAGNPMAFSYFFDLEVLDSTNAGFTKAEIVKFTVRQNTPNPFDNKTVIKFNTLRTSVFEFAVYDMVGNQVYKQQIFALKGVNTIEFKKENLPSGVYFYRLSDNENSVVRRMIIK